MTLHNPALHAPPVAAPTDDEAAAARRRAHIETAITLVVTFVAILIVSVAGVAIELG